jgi:hypothetical protein
LAMTREGHWRFGKTIGAKARYLLMGMSVMANLLGRRRYRLALIRGASARNDVKPWKSEIEPGLPTRQSAGRLSCRIDSRVTDRVRMSATNQRLAQKSTANFGPRVARGGQRHGTAHLSVGERRRCGRLSQPSQIQVDDRCGTVLTCQRKRAGTVGAGLGAANDAAQRR